jgi:regulatory protein
VGITSKKLTPQQATVRIRHFCAYQERSHSEVTQKLYSFGLSKKEVAEIITELIEENFLNEERFACAYASGKFKVNEWGKQKISFALTQKGVSSYNVKRALKQIDEADYLQTITKLASQKFASLTKDHLLEKKHKTAQYLLQKGYEWPLINQVMALWQ